VLGELVGDFVPGGFVADEDVGGGANGGGIDEGAQGDMDADAVVDYGMEEGTADVAVDVVVRRFVAENQDVLLAVGDGELGSFDPGEGLEGAAGRAAAIGAVAIEGVGEFVGDSIPDGPAEALSSEKTGKACHALCYPCVAQGSMEKSLLTGHG